MPVVYWLPSNGLGRSGLCLRPRGSEWLLEDCLNLRAQGVHTLVSMLTKAEERELQLLQEFDCCNEVGLHFSSWPLLDRGTPPSILAWTQRFEQWSAGIGEQTIVVHCRQGIGRSSLWLTAWLAWQGQSVAETLEAIAEIRG